MSGNDAVVVVGAGLAGASYVAELRGLGYPGPIMLVGDEGRPPYDRPPLSKEYLLTGQESLVELPLPELASCELVLDDPATGLDPEARTVRLRSGRVLPYAALVFATGASAKPPPPLGFSGPVLTLRTLEDAHRLRGLLQPGRRLAVIGGGIIGLEVAATARKIGAAVDVIEAAPRLLSRNACEDLATFLRDAHERAGVRFHFGGFSAAEGNEITLADGSVIEADLMLWATGAVPNDQLAAAAGIECDGGILIDEVGRTSVPHVYAVGDVARYRLPGAGGIARHETWTASRDQARNAATALMQPDFVPQASAFYYWTDQYEYKVHVIGNPIGQRNVVKPGRDAASFAIYHVTEGYLSGVSIVNNNRLLATARRLVQKRPPLDADALLAMPEFDPKTLL
jgi:3-phenylpropionate/trans-cinnamate dioxygenase ferredoxin reductase subunit